MFFFFFGIPLNERTNKTKKQIHADEKNFKRPTNETALGSRFENAFDLKGR